MILPGEEESQENLENFIHICKNLAGTGMAAYIGVPCFAEELQDTYRELLRQDKDNVAVLQGIVENGGEIQEEQAQKKVFQEFLSVFRREKWEEAEVLSEKVWPGGSRIRKKSIFSGTGRSAV